MADPEQLTQKLRDVFADMSVFKSNKTQSSLTQYKLPSFLRDWLLHRFSDEEGHLQLEDLHAFIEAHVPTNEDANDLKTRLSENEEVQILAKFVYNIDLTTGIKSFNLPDLGPSFNEKVTRIPDNRWDALKDVINRNSETWAMLQLGYDPPTKSPKKPGYITLEDYNDFCPYEVDVDYYKEARRQFSLDEWIDLLLGAIDFNAQGFESERQKLTLISRLLPFVENRVNLIELAPKGTGKTTLFGYVSRYGQLLTGAGISRATLLYNVAQKKEGSIVGHDFVTLDEVQTMQFSNDNEMGSTLKNYLEKGVCTVGDHEVRSNAGMILCGNIDQQKMDQMSRGQSVNLLSELPKFFHESALVDRFHGYIRGQDLPRVNQSHHLDGWALNSEYFTTILHELRSDGSQRSLAESLLDIPEKADHRDSEAILRLTTAYLKLLFPHARTRDDLDPDAFERYCLNPAKEMRAIIREQMAILDPHEYGGKKIPNIVVRR